MRSSLTVFTLAQLLPIGCTISDADRCGDDMVFVDASCVIPATGGGTPDAADGGDSEGGPTEAHGLGASCTCEGAGCEQQGIPVPAGGTIIGCEDVPQPWPGAKLACMRTSAIALGSPSYFANGYCTLLALRCAGSALICDSATVGDYDAMVTCPAGSALVRARGEVDVMGMQASLETALCAPLCESDLDCRPGESDPALAGEPAGYTCHAIDSAKFCYDPRNLSTDATATEM